MACSWVNDYGAMSRASVVGRWLAITLQHGIFLPDLPHVGTAASTVLQTTRAAVWTIKRTRAEWFLANVEGCQTVSSMQKEVV